MPTERGMEYQREIRQRNLRSAIVKWKRGAGDMGDLLAECQDIETLSKPRKDLLTQLEEVKKAAESLCQISLVEEPIETLQSRTERLRNDINTRIRELRDEVQSTSSRSKMSSKISSGRSKSRSTKAMKAEAAAKAAEIKVQMKYQEGELEVKTRESQVKLQKESDMAEARLHAIVETDEDTTLMKLPEAEEDAEQRVESYIQTLPIETTMQQDIQAPVTAVPASTAMNIVLVGPSGAVPATGTPTPVVPPVLLPPSSTAVTLPVVTSSILTSSTSWLTTLPSASVSVTSVKASISFRTTD